MARFENVEDAVIFINAQLLDKGYVKPDQSIKINGEVDDTKLVINTINKLLKGLNNKNQQLTDLQQRLKAAENTPKPCIERSPHSPKAKLITRPSLSSGVAAKRHSDLALRKSFKVRMNKLQSNIDELCSKLQSERDSRSNDITWQTHHDITGGTEGDVDTHTEENAIESYREQITLLLQRQATQQELQNHLLTFLDNVNRFTYSSAILGIPDMKLKEQDPTAFKQLSQGDTTNGKLIELINDWYEIIQLSQSDS